MSMAVGDLATWVGAVATVGLLIGAVVTARYAIKAFHTQREEVKVLKDQLEQDMERRRRAQAAKVFTEPGQLPQEGGGRFRSIATITVHNTSREPIYDLQVSWHKGTTQLEGVEVLKRLMPDGSHPFQREAHVAELLAVVCFCDAAGIRWRRAPDGKLEELSPS